jgi:acyl carrier protein
MKGGDEMVDVAGRIRGFIRQELRYDEAGEDLTNDTPLLENGVIDSLGLMELVAFIEEGFGVEIDDADIRVEHFRTVADIARLVERLTGSERDPMPSASA